MPVVNPGIRRQVAGAITRLFNSAAFALPLTHTAVPTRGSIVPTFTRATTSTWPNNDGNLVTGVAGEIGFPGARRVYNKIPVVRTSENLSGWDKTGVTVESDQYVAPNGSTTMDKILASAGNTAHSIGNGAAATVVYVAGVNIFSVYLRYVNHRYAYIAMNDGTNVPIVTVDLLNGTIANTTASTTATIEQDDSGAYRVSCKRTMVSYSFGSVYVGLNNTGAAVAETWNAVGTEAIGAWGLQVEDVTAQTTQTAGEYVSVGVESAPYYHGSFVDGVKCFPTDLSGNPLTTMERYKPELAATNTCLQSNAFTTAPWGAISTPTTTQNAVGPNGRANYAWTLTDNDGASYEGIQQSSVAFGAGVSGCYSILVQKKSSSPVYPLIQFTTNTTAGIYAGLIINEVAGTVTAIPNDATHAAPTASGCISYSTDYWLVWVAGTQAGASATSTLQMYAAGSTDGATISAAGQGSTVFCDAQFEYGAGVTSPSSRINTTTIAVTRNADVLTYTGGDIPNLKTLLCDFERASGVSNVGVTASLNDNTTGNYAHAALLTATSLQFDGLRSAAVQWGQAASNAYVPGTRSKAVFSMAANDIKMAKDGVAQTPDTSATPPTVTQLQVGHLTGLYQLNGNVGGIYGWTRNLSQSELNAVSKL